MDYGELLRKYNKLNIEYQRLKKENEDLKKRLGIIDTLLEYKDIQDDSYEVDANNNSDIKVSKLNKQSSKEEKIKLYMSLFKGRNDVIAKLWSNGKGYSPYCYNEWKFGICPKKQDKRFKCSKCDNQYFATLDYNNIEKHLLGKHFIGIYPLTKDDTCYFVAIDLDEADWRETADAIISTCKANSIPVYPEISKSGKGIHLWFFFYDEIKASIARKFASEILTETMESYKNIGMESYDRLFPSQDYIQKDGFGNLIALPMNLDYRKKHFNEFVDDNLKPVDDQWLYLSRVKKLTVRDIDSYMESCKTNISDSNDDFIKRQFGNAEKGDRKLNNSDFPETLVIEESTGLIINKIQLSARAVNYLRRMASFSNQDFYKKQRLRMSTYNTPRYIQVFVEDKNYLWLPRGILEQVENLLSEIGVKFEVADNTNKGDFVDIEFKGNLRDDQKIVLGKISSFSNGVISAPTGFGKTVIGAALLAEKKVNSLVLVHTRQLAEQWQDRLEELLDTPEIKPDVAQGKRGRKKKLRRIGMLGGGKNQLTGNVDIAIMQSMFDGKEVKEIAKNYGLVIVDECHHVSASTFNQILSEMNAKYVYGLTATPKRKDGHHPNIFMQCGPLRYEVDPKIEADKRDFSHYVIPRFTSFRKPIYQDEREWHISSIYKALYEDNSRNNLIVQDIIKCIEEGGHPIVLTERTEHVEILGNLLSSSDIECILLTGKLSNKERKQAFDRICSHREKQVIIATGKLVGEGFDQPSLDTLFLVMPISWKGTVVQYVGRLHRSIEGKNEVRVYDYVDVRVGILENMYHKRLKGYRSVGYSIKTSTQVETDESFFYNYSDALKNIQVDLVNANSSFIVSMPKINMNKLLEWKEMFQKRASDGVRIMVITNDADFSKKYELLSFEESVSDIGLYGIDIKLVQEQCPKMILIDDKIAWFGDLNIFGYSDASASSMRLTDKLMINELVDVLDGMISNE